MIADVRDADAVLSDLATRQLIDFSQPAAVLMTGLLHLIPDTDDPAGLIARYMSAVVPGSYLVLSRMTDDQIPPLAAQAVRSVRDRTGGWHPAARASSAGCSAIWRSSLPTRRQARNHLGRAVAEL